MFNNLNSTLKKVLVIFLIITLTYANLVLIGNNIVKGLISYAVDGENEINGNITTGNQVEGNINTEKVEGEKVETDIEKTVEEPVLLNIENKDIHKTTISEQGEVEYTENLQIDLSAITDTSKVTIEDIESKFYNNDETLNEEITLTYKNTTINKAELLELLGEEGKIVIKDVLTNKVLVELTKQELTQQEIDVKEEQKFTVQVLNEETQEEISAEEIRSNITVKEETVEIEYVLDVRNIKYELTNITVEKTEPEIEENIEDEEPTEEAPESEEQKLEFVITNKKNISNINDIEKLDNLQQRVKYIINEDTQNEKTLESVIKFKDTITKADFTIDNNEWVVGQANTVKYTITLDTASEKSELFVNPIFLLELPSSVESVNNEKSEFIVNNDNGAFTSKRVFETTLAALNKKIAVITLEGAQTLETIQVEGEKVNTTIDLTLELNVTEKATEGNETTKLYYKNDTVTAYESGKGFDSAEVTVNMIMESEPKEEILEAVDKTKNIFFYMVSSREDILKPEDILEYNIYVYNEEYTEQTELELIDVLPEGVTLEKIEEVLNEETKVELPKADIYNEETRTIKVNIDKIDAATVETEETTKLGARQFEITVKTNNLEEGIFSREIKNTVKLQKSNNIIGEDEAINTVSDVFLKVETEKLAESINENDMITVALKITNQGLINANNVKASINLPQEISPSMYEEYLLSENGEEEIRSEGTLISNTYEVDTIEVPAEKTYYLKLIGTIENIGETKQLSIKGTVNGQEISWDTEVINVPTDPENPENPTEPVEPENPENPEKPNGPEDLENPENPADPENTGKPENPNNPTNPEKPSTPEGATEGFDLSLTQYLNKVTVTNSKGTTTYNYKDTNFAKVEIHSKQMNGSKVTLEYKIVVKNEGTIPGYSRKIVDYKSKDLIFNSDLNKDWYVGDDENIYSVAFIDKLLNPGETAELTLTLEKQMTNDNIGTITNIAEIYEASNNANVEDVNSIPGDKLEGQNDISKVEVLVVTSTGTIILYTILAITVLTIIGLGFFKVKKITLNKKGGC